jgi:hypothetical protein
MPPKHSKRILSLVAFCLVPVCSEELKVGLYSVLAMPEIYLASLDKGGFDYRANNSAEIGFSASYRAYNFEVAPPLFGGSRRDSGHPRTTYFSFMTSHYAARWGFDFYFQHFKGFFADSVFYENIDRPELKTNVFIANGYFPISPKSKVTAMDEGIEENGVDINFLGLSGFSHKSLEADSSLTQNHLYPPSTPMDSILSMDVEDLFLAAGFCFNGYYRGAFFDYSLFVGGGPEYRTANVDIEPFGLAWKGHLQINGGYQWKRGAVGFKVEGDLNTVDVKSERMVFDTISNRVYVSVILF